MRHRKLLMYSAGTALLLVSLGYVALSISKNWAAMQQLRIHGPWWLCACVGAYAVSHFTTGLSWPLAIRQLGSQIALGDGIRIGLVAQIGKYLPGNAAHYLGRGALATQVGVSLKASGLSTVVELASALTAALGVAFAGLLIDPAPLYAAPSISWSTAAAALAIVGGLVMACLWLARRGSAPALLLGPISCLAISFVLSGLSLYALGRSLGVINLGAAFAVGAFALAWAAGFLVPGAPAGIGVREATLLALLGPTIGPGAAVSIAILHRLVTAVVDVVAALAGYAWTTAGTFAKK